MSDIHLIIRIYCRNIALVSSEGLVIGAAQGDAGQANLLFAAISSTWDSLSPMHASSYWDILPFIEILIRVLNEAYG